jgi:hypothetical protein
MCIDYLYHGSKFVSSVNVPRHFSFLAVDNSMRQITMHHERKKMLRMDFFGNNYFMWLLFHASALARRLGTCLGV